VKPFLAKPFRRVREFLSSDAEKNLFLSGQIAAKTVRSMQHVSSLYDVEFRVYSQWGEDGIIDWLIERLEVPVRAFVEFGVQNYVESNTRFLLANRNWRGLVMDGSAENVRGIRSNRDFWKYDLAAECLFIDKNNINDAIGRWFEGEIGLLSIDIDGNDYWVLEQINVVNPIILICEFNSVFGDVWPISIPYDPAFNRTRAHHSNLYWGASLAGFKSLAARKGYVLMGVSSGVNAFFVREDYAVRLERAIDHTEVSPSRFRESKDPAGMKTYLSGTDRLAEIAHLPAVNVETGAVAPLASYAPIYSDTWLRELRAGTAAPSECLRETV
jgi:hypothetical protein